MKKLFSKIRNKLNMKNDINLRFDDIKKEIEKSTNLSKRMRYNAIQSNTSSYYLKPRLINIAKNNLIQRKPFHARFTYKLMLILNNFKIWIKFIIFGFKIEIPKCKKIKGKFFINRNIDRATPPQFINAKNLSLISKRIRPNITMIINVFKRCINSGVNIPYLHAYYLYLYEKYDFTNSEFFWEDGGSNIDRIICDITRLKGKRVQGFMSTEYEKNGIIYNQLMCCEVFTNRKSNLLIANELKDSSWLSFKDYKSNCFSLFNSSNCLNIYEYGIVLPFFGPKTIEGKEFISKISFLMNLNNQEVLVSVHPQSKESWDSFINNQANWKKRDRKNISDFEFIISCKRLIGVSSSLRTLSKDLNKEYTLI
tara:strand:- start:4330 stop:5430 length:1101 start_codon:yes stop_codon:yes gene_type:complete